MPARRAIAGAARSRCERDRRSATAREDATAAMGCGRPPTPPPPPRPPTPHHGPAARRRRAAHTPLLSDLAHNSHPLGGRRARQRRARRGGDAAAGRRRAGGGGGRAGEGNGGGHGGGGQGVSCAEVGQCRRPRAPTAPGHTPLPAAPSARPGCSASFHRAPSVAVQAAPGGRQWSVWPARPSCPRVGACGAASGALRVHTPPRCSFGIALCPLATGVGSWTPCRRPHPRRMRRPACAPRRGAGRFMSPAARLPGARRWSTSPRLGRSRSKWRRGAHWPHKRSPPPPPLSPSSAQFSSLPLEPP